MKRRLLAWMAGLAMLSAVCVGQSHLARARLIHADAIGIDALGGNFLRVFRAVVGK